MQRCIGSLLNGICILRELIFIYHHILIINIFSVELILKQFFRHFLWDPNLEIEGSSQVFFSPFHFLLKHVSAAAAAAAKLLQSCPTLCDPMDCSLPGFPVHGILQATTLEWVAISFSNAWKWKVKVKSLSRVRLLVTHGLQPTRLLHPWDFPGNSTGVGCHCLLQNPTKVNALLVGFPWGAQEFIPHRG